ncbi:NUDIX domain-containing protein [Nocardioides guangzhouensis]|uniref:NUDIX domain-containing protein n=1 Tax=Nocardioides guangzhouensis TaxID=2497878 RepID=A0A4Q4ZE85_9ACTN|nr:NUDIX domain-containing protein [Nocardioides guangzhouensis]RYP85514.1 NUDIX domain-containing protein [Nocardioides guangzhouensis]
MAYESEYPPFYVTVDIVVLAIRDGRLNALAIRRGPGHDEGKWALPGGFVGIDEDLEPAARRELEEETGFSVHRDALQQVGTYGAPDRDPRYLRVVSVAWLAAVPDASAVVAGTDAAHAEWRPVDDLLAEDLAFDHHRILADARDRARVLVDSPPPGTRPLAAAFLPSDEFSLSRLRSVYEAVLGRELDPGNFQRRVKTTQGLVTPTGRREPAAGGRGRPAELFRIRG